MPDTSQIKGAVQRALVITRRLWVTLTRGVFVWEAWGNSQPVFLLRRHQRTGWQWTNCTDQEGLFQISRGM